MSANLRTPVISCGEASQRDFDNLWNQALRRYQKETGKDLAELPSAVDLLHKSCTTDEVIEYIGHQYDSFQVFRASGRRVLGVLKPIVHLVRLFADAGVEGVSTAVPGDKAIFIAICALLRAAKGVSERYDDIETLLKRVKACLARVATYLEPSSPPNPALKGILLDTLVQVLTVFAIATRYCPKDVDGDPKRKSRKSVRILGQRMKDYFRGLLGNADVKDALKELEELTREEQLIAAADTNTVVRKVQPKVEFVYNTAVIDALRVWLRPPNPQPRNYERKRLAGSCAWFFNDQFESWKACQKGVYWVYGHAGVGKSVLCSSIIHKLETDPEAPLLAYFFFDFNDVEKQDCRALVSSLVFQIGTRSEECISYLKGERSSSPPHDHPQYEKLFAMLLQLLRISGRTTIVIDALDELPESARQTHLFPFFKELRTLDSSHVDFRLLVTSRPESGIRRCMMDSPHPATHVIDYHNARQHKNELNRYISAQLSGSNLQRWPAAVKAKAESILIDKSNGMFLWVDLQLRHLKHCAPRDVERALLDLPLDLNQTYERILTSFPAHPVMIDRARHVFECIAFAQRPLSPAEVVDIFAMDFDSTLDPNSGLVSETCNEDPELVILELCPGLLDVVAADEGRMVVQFIHFSVREYLTSLQLKRVTSHACFYSLDDYSASLTLAKICLSALDVNTSSLMHFRTYAKKHWFNHISSRNDDGLGELLSRFLYLGSPSFARWVRKFGTYNQTFDNALHWAARLGLHHHVTRILQSQHESPDDFVDSRGYLEQTALHYAAQRGYVEVVRVLLDRGANANASDDRGNTPLHNAASSGHLGIVRALLEHTGVHDSEPVDSRCRASDWIGQTALHKAAKEGYTEITRALLDCGALVDGPDNFGSTPLHVAADCGHLDTVRALLQYPAADGSDAATLRCRLRNKSGQTALHRAAHRGHVTIARMLLEHGALVADVDNAGNTPLHDAASAGQLDIILLLLKYPATDGFDTAAGRCSARDRSGRTALHRAAGGGRAEASRMLLDHGALVTDTDERGETPLHEAAYQGHMDVVSTLLRYLEADRSDAATLLCRAGNMRGQTALHKAAREGHAEVCGLLLDHDALIDDADEYGDTPLHDAASTGHSDIVHILLKHPGNRHTAATQCSTRNLRGQTALHGAASAGHAQVTRILLDHGALIDDMDDYGDTPLHHAACFGRLGVVRVILTYPVTYGSDGTALRCGSRNTQGRTALHAAAREGHVQVCNILLERGALLDDLDHAGNTPSDLAEMERHSNVVYLLSQQRRTSAESSSLLEPPPIM